MYKVGTQNSDIYRITGGNRAVNKIIGHKTDTRKMQKCPGYRLYTVMHI